MLPPLFCAACARSRKEADAEDLRRQTIRLQPDGRVRLTTARGFTFEPPPRSLRIERIEFPFDGSGPILRFDDGRSPQRIESGAAGEWEYQAVGTMVVWRHKCGAHALVPACGKCAASAEEAR